jgi:heat shock 70kDa protein 1/2/6/8
MKEVAEVKLGKKVEKAVITVPAYFNDNQRQATKDAGSIAGLNVLRIINEPTAAAIAYGLGSGKTEKERNVLIYDLGGGTFDVSLLHIQGGVFTVKATAGDTHLGGQDFDTNLLEHFAKEFQRKTKKDLGGDARALRRLRTACERAKRTLSSATSTSVEIDSLFEGEDFTTTITRARFEELNSKAFNGTIQPVEQVLKDASLDKTKVDEIVLVGGSTRIPRIQKLLTDFFNGKKLEKSINPDEAVAYGAAVQAGILSGKAQSADTQDLLLLDVVPLSLGVAMEGNIFAPVVPRGTTVPTIKKRTFTTVADNQQTVQFPVFQGERVNCEDNTSLGEFTLAPIPPMKAGDAVLEVVFEVDVNGILKVTATEKTSGRSANITISNSVGKLSSTEIESMINDAAKFKNADEQFSKRFESKQALEAYIARVEEMISDPGYSLKLKRGQKEKIESALSDAMAQLEIEDTASDELKKKVCDHLDHVHVSTDSDCMHRSLPSSASSPRPSRLAKGLHRQEIRAWDQKSAAFKVVLRCHECVLVVISRLDWSTRGIASHRKRWPKSIISAGGLIIYRATCVSRRCGAIVMPGYWMRMVFRHILQVIDSELRGSRMKRLGFLRKKFIWLPPHYWACLY